MKQVYTTVILIFCLQFGFGQIINIPDNSFKNFLIYYESADTDDDGVPDTVLDTNGNLEIEVSEVQMIESLFIDSSDSYSVQSVVGLEYFTSLRKLTILEANLNALDLSQITNLETLYLPPFSCDFDVLDLSFQPNLNKLDANSAGLTDVVFHPNANLYFLDLGSLFTSNNEFDISQHTNLVHLNLEVSNISTINLSNNPNLEFLDVSANNLTTIDLSNNLSLINLEIENNDISTINVSQNVNLQKLDISLNNITNIDISLNLALTNLGVGSNGMTSLDVSNNLNLEILNATSTIPLLPKLTTLDLSQNLNLKSLSLRKNDISEIDLSQNINLESLDLFGNDITQLDLSWNENLSSMNVSKNNLQWLNVKNGFVFTSSLGYPNVFAFDNNQNLAYICADEDEIQYIEFKANSYNYDNVTINSFCSFTPGGEYFTLTGQGYLDLNADGCDNNDVISPFLKLIVDNSENEGVFYGYGQNGYNINLEEGSYNVSVEIENPDYFEITPEGFQVDLPTSLNPFVQDFCFTPTGVFNDLELTLIPINNARPGFNSNYKLKYRNIGTTVLSGAVNLNFDGETLDLVTSTPVTNTLTDNTMSWDYTDLLPFETRTILFTMNLNTPTETPPLDDGDFLTYLAYTLPDITEGTSIYVAFGLSQIVVNSLDPNDKTCLEGDKLSTENIGDYLHYMIRFENNGSANATNIVVKDIIDINKLDINTLRPIDGSHPFETRIKNDNEVNFIFENINLPFDDTNNDGYVVFKIKTLETLLEGDIIENGSDIYFDFNLPITTNTATTEIVEPLSVTDFNAQSIQLFPNPAKNKLEITSNQLIDKLTVIDVNGRVLHEIKRSNSDYTMDISSLSKGVYFIEIQSGELKLVKKFIKK